MQKLLTFFSKNISVYTIFNDQSFIDMLTNDIVNFEQLGPDDKLDYGFFYFRQTGWLIFGDGFQNMQREIKTYYLSLHVM